MDQPNQHQPPVISDYHSATDTRPEHPASVSLWLRHKREGGTPFLEGYVMVGEGKKIQVYGHFTALDKNAETHGERHPAIRLSAQNPEESATLGAGTAWPQNGRKDGKPVNYRTLVMHIGDDKTVYPTVFDHIGEDRQYLGFEGAVVHRTPSSEAASSETADAGMSPSP